MESNFDSICVCHSSLTEEPVQANLFRMAFFKKKSQTTTESKKSPINKPQERVLTAEGWKRQVLKQAEKSKK